MNSCIDDPPSSPHTAAAAAVAGVLHGQPGPGPRHPTGLRPRLPLLVHRRTTEGASAPPTHTSLPLPLSYGYNYAFLELTSPRALHPTLTYTQARWNGPRITFGFRNCPLCKGVPAKHATLAPRTDAFDELEATVRRKALLRLQVRSVYSLTLGRYSCDYTKV